MQVADAAVVIPMTDAEALKRVIREHQPALVIPEIEALAVDALAELEAEGITVIPTVIPTCGAAPAPVMPQVRRTWGRAESRENPRVGAVKTPGWP